MNLPKSLDLNFNIYVSKQNQSGMPVIWLHTSVFRRQNVFYNKKKMGNLWPSWTDKTETKNKNNQELVKTTSKKLCDYPVYEQNVHTE